MGEVPVFIVSLPSDSARLEAVKEQIDVNIFDFKGNYGFLGRTIPDVVAYFLTRDPNSLNNKGALGVMLSHLLIWERIATLDDPCVLVLEDDVKIQSAERLLVSNFPADFDFIFCGDQTASDDVSSEYSTLTFTPIIDVFPILHRKGVRPGTYCYVVSPKGAKKLLDVFREHLYGGHVDVRMLASGCTFSELQNLAEPDALLSELRAIRQHIPDTLRLSAYASSPALGIHVGMTSRREREDELGLTSGYDAQRSPELVRLVVWDLNDAFWKGTVSEGLKHYIRAHHDIVIELARRGIMSSICSSGDDERMRKILYATGIVDYFVSPSISWEPKVPRLRALIEDAQLLPANVMLIDGNASTRAEAAQALPGLQVEDETFTSRMLDDARFTGKIYRADRG